MVASLSSMTGFGRATCQHDGVVLAWELRSVNARGLDLRLRLPPGYEPEEAGFRARLSGPLTRGTVQAQLTRTTPHAQTQPIHGDRLDTMLRCALDLAARIPGAAPPRAEALLALPGIIAAGTEVFSPEAGELAAATAALDRAMDVLVAARAAEGMRLGAQLAAQIDQVSVITVEARIEAADQPARQLRRLRETLAALLGDASPVDPARLAQEVALLATRADVTEELDRLDGHVAAARALLAEAGDVGRRFDFLAQEFLREANTLCSKSASLALTALGLRLKSVIDQIKEQVQNLA